MRRLAVLASVFVVLAGVGAAARGPAGTAAQDAAPAALAGHPVVGAWRLSVDLGHVETFPAIGVFHADGSYTQVQPDDTALVGVWRPTGARTAELTLYNLYTIDGKLASGEARLAVEVDETGNAVTYTGTFVGLFEDGSIDIAVEAPASGTRLGVLPVAPLGTRVLPPDLTAAGTPAP